MTTTTTTFTTRWQRLLGLARVVSEGRRADGTWEVFLEGDVVSPGGTCRTKSISYWQYRHGKESGLGRKDLTNHASNDATRKKRAYDLFNPEKKAASKAAEAAKKAAKRAEERAVRGRVPVSAGTADKDVPKEHVDAVLQALFSAHGDAEKAGAVLRKARWVDSSVGGAELLVRVGRLPGGSVLVAQLEAAKRRAVAAQPPPPLQATAGVGGGRAQPAHVEPEALIRVLRARGWPSARDLAGRVAMYARTHVCTDTYIII